MSEPKRPPRDIPTGGKLLLQVTALLLMATAALLVWVGAGTLRASRDVSVRSGLDYEGFLDAVDQLIQEAGDTTLLAFEEVEGVLGNGRRVTFDTLRILADAEAFPAFARAGFLNDQVQVFNRFQRDRLDLAGTYPEWWDRLSPLNPSIFRSYARPDGSRGLTRAPAAWSLRVRSPLDGEWDGEVRAMDVVRGSGLMSPRVEIRLQEPTSLLVPVGGREQACEFVPDASEVRIYCLSEERIAQATLRMETGRAQKTWARAGWADLWVDGRRVPSGDSVEIGEGSVLRLEPLDPVVYGDHWQGVLSSKQWINGRMRRRSNPPPPLDLFAGLGDLASAANSSLDPNAYLRVSVHAEASLDLSARLKAFLDSEVDLPLGFGVLVLARIPDGEIVAVAEVGERANRGRSSLLERVAPGSAVKPLLAAAVLSRRPELAGMQIRARSGSVSSVLGMPPVGSRRRFTTALNCAPPGSGQVDLRYFLRCSNNEYAASLVLAGLSEDGVPGSTWRGAHELPLVGTQVPRSVLLRSPLSEGLSDLFDLPTDPTIADARRRSGRVWAGARLSDGSPFAVPNEVLPSESRPALLAPGSPEGTDLSLLYRYAYGAWENQWTLLDLINGFGRIVTDTRLQIRFTPSGREGGLEGRARSDGLGLGGEPWYAEVLGGLRDVGIDGTAPGLQSAWEAEGLPSEILAKTGTLNEAGEATASDDLFAKSLLFAVGHGSDEPGGSLACGLVGGLYLRFAKGPGRGNLPSYQVEFAREVLGGFLEENWEAFGACGEGGG